MDGVDITFDAENRIRVLESSKFEAGDELEGECQGFMEKINFFSSNVADLVEVLDNQAKKIEMDKLRAIGQRNKVEQEADMRRRRAQELNALIMDKQAELDRIQFEVDSLEKVEREQKALIEKLSNNDV